MKIVEKTLENTKKCLCMTCPSYTQKCKEAIQGQGPDEATFATQKHFEGLYCGFEKSNCIQQESGCICSKCPVHSEYKLKSGYFCTRDVQA